VNASVPTGTVTFLFSDIEGSTKRWEAHRESMQAAVARHEQILSEAFARHRGFVFKTVGDAFCVAFQSARDAAGAAIDAQRALASDDFSAVDGLRVRMALHSGHAEERNGDYFGPAVNRVARLMAIGHGGQVLVSHVTHDLLQGESPAGLSLSDLGYHRLKDFAKPEHVWQLVGDGLAAAFPPLNSLNALSNNLPVQATTFRGRERDVEETKAQLHRHAVVTLVGSGGIGKTRLALQVGSELIERFVDGVWFADLSPIANPELVAGAIAGALGIKHVQDTRIDEVIPQQLKGKKPLLIVDNCEHLLEAVAALVDAVVRSAPDVRILCTSRQALGIAAESVVRLPPLAVPDAESKLSADESMAFGSVAVFVDRAKSVDSRFVMGDDDAPIVAEICRHLDGIPLAIELAAARVRALSLPHLAEKLSERFKLLTGGSRTALPRQRTLTALIDWSYDLLTKQEQELFAKLGVFAGSFGTDAVSNVCADADLDEIALLDLLTSLADKSLIVADASQESERFRLLESTRAYALEKLAPDGQRDALARRHAHYFHDLADRLAERYQRGTWPGFIADVQSDLDNYRSALEWCLTSGNDWVAGGDLAGLMSRVWFRAGLTVEGRYWIRLALDRLDETAHPRIAARLWRALTDHLSGRALVDGAERVVALYESAGDVQGTIRGRYLLALALQQIGRHDDATRIATQALAAARELGDDFHVASFLDVLGASEAARGDLTAARDLLRQSYEHHRAIGSQSGIASILTNLGELEFQLGNPEEAIRLATEGHHIDSRWNDAFLATVYACNVSTYRLAMGDVAGARASAVDGLRRAREFQYRLYIGISLQTLALIAALDGRIETAARVLGQVDAQFDALGYHREWSEQWVYDRLLAALREKLSDGEIERLRAEGAGWPEDRAVDEASKAEGGG
jgi:predicted ATPase/class 3 adenylate cyclase